MSYQSFLFRINAGRNDRKRDRSIALPENIIECRNISYGEHSKWNVLDVYYPFGTTGPLPTIVSIHGGGYVYGTKEVYRRYCMSLAGRGFAVVNFNYRLAPKWRFPAPLEDTNAVLKWVCRNAKTYHLNPHQLFLVGDSAGAQIASQFAAIATNPDYAALFDFSVPEISIKALGLNCGMYDAAALAAGKRTSIAKDYLGTEISASDLRLQVLGHITENYPAAHITTACCDFLREHARPMADFLRSKGIQSTMDCYGKDCDQKIGHVFHVNISLPEATKCNDNQCDFFRTCL
jgi:acetyl esterase/lipase